MTMSYGDIEHFVKMASSDDETFLCFADSFPDLGWSHNNEGGFDKIFIPARLSISMLLPYLYWPLVVVYLCYICICICIVLYWIEIFICWEFYSPLSAELSMDTVAIQPHWTVGTPDRLFVSDCTTNYDII